MTETPGPRVLACVSGAIVAAMLAASPAAAQTVDTPFLHDRADQAFLIAMIADGRAELAFAAIAEREAMNPRVRAWAAELTAAHARATQDLTAMAHAKDIHPPDGLDPLHQTMRERLDTLRGDAFDAAFLESIARVHRAQIDLLEHERSGGLDAELRGWAEAAIETSRAHLRQAREFLQ